MPLDPTIVMVLGGAALTIGAIAAGLAYLGVRALKTRAAHRRNVAAFLAELKTDAATAAVTGNYAYSGADVLQMLLDHRVIDNRERQTLITAADEEEERERALLGSDYPGILRAPIDDEIPF